MFIAWANEQRVSGTCMCFAIVPRGSETAVGIIQIRRLDVDFSNAEWGFAIAESWWGTGVFREAAKLVLAFAFDCVGIHRLEARAAVSNRRGNGALRKLGAIQEAVLRRSFLAGEGHVDQILWSLLESDWRAMEKARAPVQHPARWIH